jgi:DNA-binding NtrC family response regulator
MSAPGPLEAHEAWSAPPGLVAVSRAMRDVVDRARRVARVDTSILLRGEPGSVKQLLARWIHDCSPRASGAFVTLGSGALPEPVVEAELYGDACGAGLFEAADGGTLSIREVGELSAALQVRLLRTLQSREVRRAGETRTRPVDVRLIAATGMDLAEATRAGRFRRDLLQRLAAIELSVPALRERGADLLPLARWLLRNAAARAGLAIDGITHEAAARLAEHDWPGNVVELEGVIEHAVALATGPRIKLADLPESLRLAPRVRGRARTLAEVERDYVLAVLEKHAGHRGKTAAELDIGIATLFRMLKRWGASS